MYRVQRCTKQPTYNTHNHMNDKCVVNVQAAEVQQAAALLLGQLGISDVCKAAIKNSFGIVTLLKMIGRLGLDRSSKEVVVRTISVLAVDNEVNQDHIR